MDGKIESDLPVQPDAATIASYIEKSHPFIRLFEAESESFYYNQYEKGGYCDIPILKEAKAEYAKLQ